jgi:hypothetical protein
MLDVLRVIAGETGVPGVADGITISLPYTKAKAVTISVNVVLAAVIML